MSATGFERIDGGLYRRNGLIYARVREDGKRSWRGTGTNDLPTARKLFKKWREEQVLKAHGIETAEAALARNRLTVAKVLDAYILAGCPTKKMQPKSPATVRNELKALNPVRRHFGELRQVPGLAQRGRLHDHAKAQGWRGSHNPHAGRRPWR